MLKISKRWFYRLITRTIATTLIFILLACVHNTRLDPQRIQKLPLEIETTELNIWLEQGYNLEENEAIWEVVTSWEQRNDARVKLSFFSTDELTAKAKRATDAANLPDILINPKGDRLLYPQLAWQDKLEDITDIIEPIKDDYPQYVLRAITYHNRQQEKSSYYAVPIDQAGMFIFYWQDLLASIGLNESDIPHNWHDFWRFWQQAQSSLQTQQNQDIHALGLPLGASNIADDTYYLFEHILEAHDIFLFNQQGELALDRPQVRQGIIKCLDWYARLYQQGYIPADAIKWSNLDNNRNLLNRLILMTPNTTFSIPATVHRDRDTYLNRLGIAVFPNKPSGQAMRHLISIRQAVIFKDSPHKSLAKDFLRHYIQPQIAINYHKTSNSRTLPVRTSVWSDSFWHHTQDPYLATAKKVLSSKQTKLFYTVEYPAYSQVLAENIWGKALNQVTVEKLNPEKVADQAIARIKEIFAKWETNLDVTQ